MGTPVNPAKNCADIDEAMGRGDLLAAFELADAALKADGGSIPLQFRKVLSLARMGAWRTARRLFDEYGLAAVAEADCVALDGRLRKDMALAAAPADRPPLLAQAAAAYRVVYARFGSYFGGVNAATLTLLAGDVEGARSLATSLLDEPALRDPQDYYAAATLAECCLLLGRGEDAEKALAVALGLPGANSGARASTLRQLYILQDAPGIDSAVVGPLIDLLRPPPVLVFCGHRWLAAQDETEIAARIDAVLDAEGIVTACGALAFGADIMVAEAILRRGGSLHVVMPFDQADFEALSVVPGGPDWTARYKAVLAQAKTVTMASRSAFVGDDGQLTYGSHIAMGIAMLRARHLMTSAVQIAIWDGTGAQGLVGTGRDVTDWQRLGNRTIVIDPGPIVRPPFVAQPSPPSERGLASFLFADFSGFSKIGEAQLPRFWTEVMTAVSDVLNRHGEAVLFSNTWGDALFAVIDRPDTAARIALDIQAQFSSDRLTALGFTREAGMRIALHHGPVYSLIEPIANKRSFIGTEVTLTARIEPVTPVGEVYVTQAFAAMAAFGGYADIACDFVGTKELAKGYGHMAMYRLSDAGPR